MKQMTADFILDRIFNFPKKKWETMTTHALNEMIVKWKIHDSPQKGTKYELIIMIDDFIKRNNINMYNYNRIKIESVTLDKSVWYETYGAGVSFSKTYSTLKCEYYIQKIANKPSLQVIYYRHVQKWTEQPITNAKKVKNANKIKDPSLVKYYNELRSVIILLELKDLHFLIQRVMKDHVPNDVIGYTNKLYCGTILSTLTF